MFIDMSREGLFIIGALTGALTGAKVYFR